jgi:hypothetical protein
MSALDEEILRKVAQWLSYADEDLRLARHGLTLRFQKRKRMAPQGSLPTCAN